MTNLLVDYFEIDSLQVISEGTGTSPMRVKGVFGRADEFNKNKRTYPKSILEREVTRLQPLVESGRLVGELDHPDHTSVRLSSASHKIDKLYWDGKNVMGEATILNTPVGKVTQQLIRDGVNLGISSRGIGTLSPIGDSGNYTVDESYKCITYDLVADPFY